jgi:T-complex protein 1 subunit beta
MDTDKIKIYGSRVKVDSMDKVAAIEAAEKSKMKGKVEKILAHSVDGQPINCFINRQLIYNYPESIFAEHGIMAIEHADFDGIERLAAVLGGDVVSTFDAPQYVTIGQCAVIEQVRMCTRVCIFCCLLYDSPPGKEGMNAGSLLSFDERN